MSPRVSASACALRGLVAGMALLAALAVTHRRASAQEFHVDPAATNLVRFISSASIEEFDGVTHRIDGYVLVGAPELSSDTGGEGTAFYLEVDLGSLETGIGLRNRHMRDNYLEVDRFPFAIYEGVIERTVAVGGGFRVTTLGTLSIHGVARERRLTCGVDPVARGYRTQCRFEVLLTDHGVEIPRVMFLKLANEIRLELDFTVVPAGPPNGGAP